MFLENKTKEKFCIVILMIMAVLSLIGCATDSSFITTDGSTSMEKVIGILGEVYENEKGISVTYNPTGSSAGISSVDNGRCDIGLTSRYLREDEANKLREIVIAYDGIAVIVNQENKIANLSLEEIEKIFKGEITNWKNLGGDDLDIICIGREAGSGTRDGFETATNTINKCKYRQELTSSGDVITTVSNNKNAIGYASIASLKDTVKIISIDSVIPTITTIKNQSYKIQRPFILVVKEDNTNTITEDFIKFVTSKEASTYIEKAGVIPAYNQ